APGVRSAATAASAGCSTVGTSAGGGPSGPSTGPSATGRSSEPATTAKAWATRRPVRPAAQRAPPLALAGCRIVHHASLIPRPRTDDGAAACARDERKLGTEQHERE